MHRKDKKYFVYTVPKAGTYLLAEFLEVLGLKNTGYHVSVNEYLDTKRFDLNTNRSQPSTTGFNGFCIELLRQIGDGSFAFGHIPIPLVGWALPSYRFICSYRAPRQTLVSEFIDFRYRRIDIEYLSTRAIPSDEKAFLTYLTYHGRNHLRISSTFVGCASLYENIVFDGFGKDRAFFINFNDFLESSDTAASLASHFGWDTDVARAAWQRAIAAETKTKARDIPLDRNAIWTSEAEEIYNTLGGDQIHELAKSIGLVGDSTFKSGRPR